MELPIDRIRRDTSDSHGKLNNSKFAADLLSNEISPIRYLEILIQWSKAWRSIDEFLQKIECSHALKSLIPLNRSQYAHNDIVYLVREFDINDEIRAELNNKTVIEIPPTTCDFKLAGYCYVARGASLGGLQIARHISNVLDIDRSLGVSFFHPAETEHLTWPQWRNYFNNFIQSEENYLNALNGANTLFSVLTTVFDAKTTDRAEQ